MEITLFLILLLITYYIQLYIYITFENRNPTKALGWLILLFVLPVLSFIFYVVLRKRWRLPDPTQRTSYTEIASNEKFHFVFEGTELFEHLFADLEKAQSFIHIAFFILRDDHIGQRLKDILMRKAKNGCQVRLIYDGIGSISLSKKYIQDLKTAGVQAYAFYPLKFPWLTPQLNTRYHRKIIVIDNKIAYVGGFNIGKEYVGENPKLGHWRDAHLIVKGDTAESLNKVFVHDFYLVSNQKLTDTHDRIKNTSEDKLNAKLVWSAPTSSFPYSLFQVFSFLYEAKNTILIATPYLVPDQALLTALKERATAGINITIMLPSRADHRIVYYATHSYIEELLVAGIKFYQYEDGFMHSKMMIRDDAALFIGTTNLDMRSFYLNYEVNVEIYDESSIKVAKNQFLKDLEVSTEITLATYQKRSNSKRLAENIARLFSPLM